jgi:5-aminopentanamidase
MPDPILRVATIQTAPAYGDLEANMVSLERWSREAAGRGADLVVFPEAFLQGLVYHDQDSATREAVALAAPELDEIGRLSAELNLGIVVGFLERTGPSAYSNSALTALPDGTRRVYRKTHLTELGADRWAVPGDELAEVFEYRGTRCAVLICYDVRFPEVSRVLALRGADLLLLPTNSPVGYEGTYDHAARTRAWENRVWFLVANRVGVEGDATFIGRSLSVDPLGNTVHQLAGGEHAMLLTDVDPARARSKALPGHAGAVYSFMHARRPALYGELASRPGGPGSANRARLAVVDTCSDR